MENFVGDFSDLNWDKLKDPCEDVNAKFTFFLDQHSKCIRKHVSLTKVSQKEGSVLQGQTMDHT